MFISYDFLLVWLVFLVCDYCFYMMLLRALREGARWRCWLLCAERICGDVWAERRELFIIFEISSLRDVCSTSTSSRWWINFFPNFFSPLEWRLIFNFLHRLGEPMFGFLAFDFNLTSRPMSPPTKKLKKLKMFASISIICSHHEESEKAGNFSI